MNDFIKHRLEMVKTAFAAPDDKIQKSVLVHFIPGAYKNSITPDLSDPGIQDKMNSLLKNSLGSIIDCRANRDGLFGLATGGDHYFCFRNGIIEMFRAQFETGNKLLSPLHHIKIDNIINIANVFIKGAMEINNSFFSAVTECQVYVTIINVRGAIIYSFDDRLYTLEPIDSQVLSFRPVAGLQPGIPVTKQVHDKIIMEIKKNYSWKAIAC